MKFDQFFALAKEKGISESQIQITKIIKQKGYKAVPQMPLQAGLSLYPYFYGKCGHH